MQQRLAGLLKLVTRISDCPVVVVLAESRPGREVTVRADHRLVNVATGPTLSQAVSDDRFRSRILEVPFGSTSIPTGMISTIKDFLKTFPVIRTSHLRWQSLKSEKKRARLYVLDALPKNGVGIEIGVHEGDFSRFLLDIARPAHLHLVDPWRHFEEATYDRSLYGGMGSEGRRLMDERFERVRVRFEREQSAGRVSIHRTISENAATRFEDESIDWVYIDGNHQYEFVMRDLELFWPKVKSGGVVAGDDYGVDGWWDNGVQKAVDKFVGDLAGVETEVVYDQFLIRKV